MQIEITNCAECPFILDGDSLTFGCRLNYKIEAIRHSQEFFYNMSVHPLCPLKQESITVKLAEDGHTRDSNVDN